MGLGPRHIALTTSALLLSSCFGSLSIGANLKVEPHTILPGSTATIALDIQGDGLLGNAIHQQLTPAAFEGAETNGTKWEVRDNSDSQRVRVTASSSADFPATFDASKLPGTNADGIRLVANDYVFIRTYALTVTLPASQSSSLNGTSTDQFSQQAAAAALAAVRYQWSALLPGTVGTTNGLRSDDGRVVWNINMSSAQAQTLTAESTYVDVPRIALALALVILLIAAVMLVRRRGAGEPPPTAPSTTPPPSLG